MSRCILINIIYTTYFSKMDIFLESLQEFYENKIKKSAMCHGCLRLKG